MFRRGEKEKIEGALAAMLLEKSAAAIERARRAFNEALEGAGDEEFRRKMRNAAAGLEEAQRDYFREKEKIDVLYNDITVIELMQEKIEREWGAKARLTLEAARAEETLIAKIKNAPAALIAGRESEKTALESAGVRTVLEAALDREKRWSADKKETEMRIFKLYGIRPESDEEELAERDIRKRLYARAAAAAEKEAPEIGEEKQQGWDLSGAGALAQADTRTLRLFFKPVRECGFSESALFALEGSGAAVLGVACRYSAEDILKMPMAGRKEMENIKETLGEYGLRPGAKDIAGALEALKAGEGARG